MFDWWVQLKYSKTVLRDVYMALMVGCMTIGFWGASNIFNIVEFDDTPPFATLPARFGFIVFCYYLFRATFRVQIKPMAKVSVEDELAMNPNMILVVEDDDQQMKIWNRVIKRLGYYPENCKSKAETIAFLQNLSESPRLMFIDFNLTDGSGIDLANDIRRMGFKYPIVGMSGMKNAVDEKLLTVFNEALQKPLRPAEMGERIEFWIKH
jgi:CheY-like chemotaxis protein